MLATPKDILLARVPPGGAVPPDLAAMPDQPHVPVPIPEAPKEPASAVVAVVKQDPGTIPILIQESLAPATSPADLLTCLTVLQRVTLIEKMESKYPGVVDRLAKTDLVCKAGNYAVVTARGIDYLVDFGLL